MFLTVFLHFIQKEDEETAKVLEEFVTTFEDTSKSKMKFVRGAIINPDKGDP